MSDINGPDDEDSMSDRTIVRPRGVPTAANPPPPAATAPPPAAPPSTAPSPTPPRPTTQTDISAFLHGGMNPLVQLASPLLLLAVQLRHSVDLPDMPRLREQTVAQVRKFEQEAQTAGISTQTITAARYVLCTMLDESILNAPWGEQSGWAQKTLLVTFHSESYGGAKFFQILERLLADFSRHIDLIEMMYVCLVLGFGGRYAIEPGGRARLAEIQDDLYRRLRAQRTAPAEELSPHWHGIQDRRNPLIRYIPLWVVGAAAACILLGVFLFFFVRLNDTISPVSARLSEIGLESAVPPDMANFARLQPVVVHKTLRQLLAAEIQAGQLAVIEKKQAEKLYALAHPRCFLPGPSSSARRNCPC